MTYLVELEKVKNALHVDHEDDDDTLSDLITAASQMIINYLGARATAVLKLDTYGDSPANPSIPPEVKTATLMLVGYLYRNPDGDPDRDFSQGNLPWSVTAMIYQLRDPAMA